MSASDAMIDVTRTNLVTNESLASGCCLSLSNSIALAELRSLLWHRPLCLWMRSVVEGGMEKFCCRLDQRSTRRDLQFEGLKIQFLPHRNLFRLHYEDKSVNAVAVIVRYCQNLSIYLTLQSIVVALCTTCLEIQQFCVLPTHTHTHTHTHTLYLCVRCVADIVTAFLTRPTGWSWWVQRREHCSAETAPCCLLAGTMRGAVEAGQLGEAWGPSNKSYCSEIEEHKKRQMFVLFTCF